MGKGPEIARRRRSLRASLLNTSCRRFCLRGTRCSAVPVATTGHNLVDVFIKWHLIDYHQNGTNPAVASVLARNLLTVTPVRRGRNMATLGQINRMFCRFSRCARSACTKEVRFAPKHPKSTFQGLAIDHDCKVEVGVTSDGATVVCYHPAADVPYEMTQPIPRPDPITSPPETHDQVLKARLNKGVLQDKQAPTIEELSNMFYTTKHRWYPVGQYHMRRRKKNPPKDR
ncbi:large ribosomal subunit protein mL42 [Denticeps clupeoides]|uniref:large ribosomal subunit protein mL42 n=1 Tax=Denticeps clupeoides TaxID=299321 RepID=UPI0010A479C8|nr:39S ribosomal protein L42, mitochondrial [Denticeps clupeoides]